MAILVLDSGVGGLTVLREVRAVMPTTQIIYVGDDGGFPYGEWPEEALVERVVGLVGHYLSQHPIELAIVACNTASTLIMPSLRERFDIPFVGTVPAIKPATERTVSGMVSVLATPGTVNRQYTQSLIDEFADGLDVNLVGSSHLARLAEHYMQHRVVDTDALWDEIRPCFLICGEKRTDIVVLGCTHYPFLVNEMRKLAPWPVDWIDASEAIALRAQSVLADIGGALSDTPGTDLAYLTSDTQALGPQRLLQGFGLSLQPHGCVPLPLKP